MLLKKKMMFGLILCVLILGAFLPTLMGLKKLPQKTFGEGEDLILVTQSIDRSLPNMSLASGIEEQDFVDAVSPEIYAYSSLMGLPITIRGVDFPRFKDFEGIEIVKNSTSSPSVLIGRELSRRLGIGLGSEITITGTTKPAFYVSRIDAVFSGSNDDELLLPLKVVRKFVGFGSSGVSAIRVKTDRPDLLLEYLQSGNYTVNMGSGGSPSKPVDPSDQGSNRIILEEIALRYTNLSFDIGNLSYMSVFIQRGSGSVAVVVSGFVFLSCALTFIGITAILAKGISEKKKDIGVLYGIGASDARITLFFLKETLLLAFPSALIGTTAGFLLSKAITTNLSLIAFGKYITPDTSPSIFLGVTILSILIAAISCICCLFYLLKWNPSELISQSAAETKVYTLKETLNED